MANSDWLVVLIILKKYEFVNGKDYYIPYIMEKKHMFETTNQLITGGLQPCFVWYLQDSLTQL